MEIKQDFDISVVGDAATATLKDKDAFISAAKDAGIEKDTLTTVEKFTKAYLDAAGNAVAAHAEKTLKEDKTLATVVYNLPFGTKASDGVHMTVTREKNIKLQFGADAGKEIVKSQIRTVVDAHYMKPTTAAMKEHEKTLTAALLG